MYTKMKTILDAINQNLDCTLNIECEKCCFNYVCEKLVDIQEDIVYHLDSKQNENELKGE